MECVVDLEGEGCLKRTDVADVSKSGESDWKELHKSVSDEVLAFEKKSNSIEKSNSTSSEDAEIFLKLKEEITQKNNELLSKDRWISKLQLSLRELQKQLFEMELKLVPDTVESLKSNIFILIKKNLDKVESDLDHFRFYALRSQKRYVEESLDRLRIKYPNYEVLYRAEDPKDIDFFNSLSELKNVRTCENHLDTSMGDEEFMVEIEKLLKNKLIESLASIKIKSEEFQSCSRKTGIACKVNYH